MDDLWARIGLIAAVIAVAIVITWAQRRRALNPIRTVDPGDLAPGVYFFSSDTCGTCREAREKLAAALGSDAFTELAWERDPGPFTDLGVDAVPAVMIVEEGGKGRLHVGQPDEMLLGRRSWSPDAGRFDP